MIRAPVLPAETKASPFPSASRRRPTAMEQPLCSLRMLLGSSSIVMTSEASTISIPSSGTGVLRRHPADIRLVSRQENGVTVFRHRQGCSPQDFEGGVIPAVGVDDDPQMRFLSVCGFHGFATFLFIDPVQAGTGPGCPGHGGPGPRPAAACPGTGSSRGGNIPKLAPMG